MTSDQHCEALTKEYTEFLIKRPELAKISADKLLFEISQEDPKIRSQWTNDSIAWLKDFIKRWEDLVGY
jgi:hypothetical protein